MAEPSRIIGEQHFMDDVVFNDTVTLPDSTVTNAKVSASAAIAATKLEHQTSKTYAQPSDQTAAFDSQVIHTVYGSTGTIVAFEVGAVVACTSTSTVDVDLHKNGTSILSSPVEIDSADTAYTLVSGTVSTSTLADGDVLEVIVLPNGADADDFALVEDFVADAGDTLPALWAVDAETANSTEDYVTDSGCGVYSLINSSDSEAQSTQLFTSDNLWIDLFERPIVEWRAKLDLTGTNALGSADQRLVLGVCSAHTNAEDDLDAVATSAWFRMEGTSANILVEADDGSTDTDDQDSGADLVDNTWTHFRIDFSSLADVKFYINGTEQSGATVVMSNIASSTMVQPIACLQRDAGAEEEKMYLDSFKVTSGRSLGTLAKGVFATTVIREDAT